MDAHEMQRKLYWNYRSSHLILPNFAPLKWFECDIFRVTQSGYFYEYEIKLSMSDFRADAKKSDYDWKARQFTSKYQQIRDAKGPTRFFYVTIAELGEKILAELPEFAGLIIFDRHIRIIKPAPILHRNKVSTHIIREARKRIVGRYWDFFISYPEKQKIRRLENVINGE